MDLDYYMAIDEQHHQEVYELLIILNEDQLDPVTIQQQAAAEQRLEELKQLSQNTPKP